MKKLFCYADRYLEKSDWRDIAMLKFCLFSMGIFAGGMCGGGCLCGDLYSTDGEVCFRDSGGGKIDGGLQHRHDDVKSRQNCTFPYFVLQFLGMRTV